jgi:ABC-2 type transport system ATP-binding protein
MPSNLPSFGLIFASPQRRSPLSASGGTTVWSCRSTVSVVLELVEVTRRFGGVTAVDGVSFAVRPGVLTGFIGANGAGKTTSMRIVLGVLQPDAGRVLWNGLPTGRRECRTFGYMPEERGLYPRMAVLDQLVFFGRLHGLDGRTADRKARELLGELGLAGQERDRLERLSLGNQQRAQVAAALIHDPVLLVLDEPFSGLDPVAVDVMAGLLRRRAAEGVPVVFSSHQLDVVERLCDDVVIINRGRVVAAGSSDGLRTERAGLRYRLVLGADTGWLHQEPGVCVSEAAGNHAVVELTRSDAAQRLLARALEHGPVHEFCRAVPTLSEIFREAVQ